MQKIPLDTKKKESYLQKYLLIDTGFKVNNLPSDFEDIMLSKKRITCKGFWRLNCLISMKSILNNIKGFETKFYDFLPCLYVKRIIKKRNGI